MLVGRTLGRGGYSLCWMSMVALWLTAAALCPGQTPTFAEAQLAQADAPAEQSLPVLRVLITGHQLTNEEYIRAQLRTRPGQPYDERTVQEDIRRLLGTGRFDNATATRRMADGQVEVIFNVAERPEVRSVEFVGNKKFPDKDLIGELEFAAGDPVDHYRINQGRRNIERLYKEAGYNYVTATIDEELLRDEWRVVYNIVEGPRVRVRTIRFEGNRSYPRERLIGKVKTKEYVWVFRPGLYDPEQVQRDADDLRNFYRNEGYLDALVTPRLEFRSNRTDLEITFVIAEGPRHVVRSIDFDGNVVYDDELLLSQMKLSVGRPYINEVAKADAKRITEQYTSNGYIYAGARPVWVYAEGEDAVDVTVRITEGELYRVGSIRIRGNQQTQDRVVRRELRFYPGDLYNLTATTQAEQRLYETRLFADARITPLGEEPGVRDALVEVNEADTTTLLFSVGVTSNSGVLGGISIENRNFDLYDWPRSFGELFRGRAFKGAGQTLRLQFEPGTELTRGRIDFREPYLLDRPISLGVSGYVFQRGRDEYDEERAGGIVSFGRRFSKGLLSGWVGEVALRNEWVDIGGTDFLTAKEIREDAGGSFLSTVKGSLVRDRTDSLFSPSRGDRLSFSWEQAGALGGDYTFSKLMAGYWWHYTLRTDVFDRKSVLSLRVKGGYIFGDVPVFERFFGGGIGSIRGFEYRGVGPRAGIRDDRIGGRTLLLTGAEYSFPVYGKSVRGLLFTDMGSVEEDFELTSWRLTLGFGARIVVQYFGPVPLSFDFGFPVARDSDDDEQIFSFSFGATF
ncbi:MAG TPA: outer membrane protein assembly factor BamA [Phycisphaerae bacterium]|nr:outer membrane protein assembly factor BamA [Phycisphaerae bacterium]